MNGRTTSRRTVAKGLAWATPAVIVAAPTPTVAASAVTCPPMPTGSAWTTTISTPRTSAPATWSGNTFTMLTDANSTTATTTVTTTATIPVTAGVTYNFQFLIQAAMGYTSVGTCATVNSTLSIDVLAGALPTNLFRGYTQTGAGT